MRKVNPKPNENAPQRSRAARGRLFILAAAILWSTSGLFVRSVDASQSASTIAMYRGLSAGLVLCAGVFLLRRRPTFHPAMFAMATSFAAMNYLFILSMTLTTVANTIFLQYTAPLWMFAASIVLLGEPFVARNCLAVAGAGLGVAVLIAGEWNSELATQRMGIVCGLASGVTYAGVAISLRFLRDHDPFWLAAINHLSAGVAILLAKLTAAGMGAEVGSMQPPPLLDLTTLVLFGVFQMALPYVMFATGLKDVSPQEAAILTLAEPVLNPLWTYLRVGEQPSAATTIGGVILVAMLALRYIPRRKRNDE